MGHQVNFYVTPKDIMDIERRLQGRDPLAIILDRSNTSEPRVVSSLDFQENGRPWLFLFLVRPEDLPKVVMNYVPAQGYWTVETLYSPVIELTRSFFDGQILRQGRVYYVDGFYGPDRAWIEKREAFRSWAKSVLALIKKTLKRREDGWYIGPDALAWLESSGGKLVD